MCSRQVGDLLRSQKAFADKKANVILIYPGPKFELTLKANEFIDRFELPDNFHLVVDPDYRFTNAYHLRWNARRETSYPSTFVVGKDGKVRFAKISKTHGGRPKTKDILAALN